MIVQPRSEHERPSSLDSRSVPSCFEPHGIVGASSARPIIGELFVTGRRDGCVSDCATTRMSVRIRMKVDGSEGRNSRPT